MPILFHAKKRYKDKLRGLHKLIHRYCRAGVLERRLNKFFYVPLTKKRN